MKNSTLKPLRVVTMAKMFEFDQIICELKKITADCRLNQKAVQLVNSALRNHKLVAKKPATERYHIPEKQERYKKHQQIKELINVTVLSFLYPKS
ncbi:hypothetical protein T01_9661 [Trichinella spiralis]|uniref:Uncharacterized protein n=1 Tax=Trichinella spiralis TaxID=6334 RepID=A0A0V1BBP2_TRISP|nr:hypothetical protein T01_9661 [Trichinella spiralis]